ncbi:hypothetical protein TRFO_15798 [Tritrichomonas foetus]|uniref:CUE domain-containing protein n=1 Tax=Tritrichomonas foetus TaxID=1144522 RepID=A0A1J4KRJ7_9EUKA|nr:hypothetical protein TRFO_15798 [Tritrichomonas foetus]|eukprot:OHT13913.1 hypothetical protein TRFO_15798 [Tritrichomonas foetus]
MSFKRDYDSELKQLMDIFGTQYDSLTLREILLESPNFENAMNRIIDNPDIGNWNSKGKKTETQTSHNKPYARNPNGYKDGFKDGERRTNGFEGKRGGRGGKRGGGPRQDFHDNRRNHEYRDNYHNKPNAQQVSSNAPAKNSPWANVTIAESSRPAHENNNSNKPNQVQNVPHEEPVAPVVEKSVEKPIEHPVVQEQPKHEIEPQHEEVLEEEIPEPEPEPISQKAHQFSSSIQQPSQQQPIQAQASPVQNSRNYPAADQASHIDQPEAPIFVPNTPAITIPTQPQQPAPAAVAASVVSSSVKPKNGSLLSLPVSLKGIQPNYENFGNFSANSQDSHRQHAGGYPGYPYAMAQQQMMYSPQYQYQQGAPQMAQQMPMGQMGQHQMYQNFPSTGINNSPATPPGF